MLKLTEKFTLAMSKSQEWHASQVRKGSEVPYFTHPMSVAALVLEDGGSEDEAIAALLHDTIEDCGGEVIRQKILALFGERILTLVDGCSEKIAVPKPPWRERKQEYLDRLRSSTPEVIRISLADKLHNCRSIDRDWQQEGDLVWEKFTAGKEGTLWYYRSLAAVFHDRTDSWMVDELSKLVENPGWKK
jgi:(p)ppGpp synthase/HD superfamily hydrolase